MELVQVSLENLIKMIPGASKMGLNNVSINPKDMAHIEAIIKSMTPYERMYPEVLKATRKQRIANGSGTSVQEINKFMKSFEMTQKMMKQMQNNKGGMKKMMKGMDLKNFKFQILILKNINNKFSGGEKTNGKNQITKTRC